ncbi:hypothetical protein AVEN_217426-2-1, partial [Araneus ventricosus]
CCMHSVRMRQKVHCAPETNVLTSPNRLNQDDIKLVIRSGEERLNMMKCNYLNVEVDDKMFSSV